MGPVSADGVGSKATSTADNSDFASKHGSEAPNRLRVDEGLTIAVGSALLADLAAATLDAVFSFGIAALLYVVTEELLVEAHEAPAPLTFSNVFLGLLVLLTIEIFV